MNDTPNTNEQPYPLVTAARTIVTSVVRKRRPTSPVPLRDPRSFPRSREEEKQHERELLYEELARRETPPAVQSPSIGYRDRDRTEQEEQECQHLETEIVNGRIECVDCGQHLDEVLDQEQEWRYYGDHDSKHTSDPSRCQFRKAQEKGIRKDLEKLNLPPKIINVADGYYCRITQQAKEDNEDSKHDIKRGHARKGIMYACVFEAYKSINKAQTPESLRKLFEINRKDGSRGVTYFQRKMRKLLPRSYLTAENYIPKICEKFNFTPSAVEEVQQLYQTLRKRSPRLDHSYPQSVASGCVFYILKSKNVDITAEQFGDVVNLSSITVTKKCNEIEEILTYE